MFVEQMMTRSVRTCRADQRLDEAARLMWEHDLGALVICNDQVQPIAMLTDRDICMAGYTSGRRLSEIRVDSAMSRELYTCHPGDRLSTAERTMRVHRVRRLPVVDDAGRLAGMFSLLDLAKICAGSRKDGALRLVDVATTLASVGRRAASPGDDAFGLTTDHGDLMVLRDSNPGPPATRIRAPSLAEARTCQPMARGLHLP